MTDSILCFQYLCMNNGVVWKVILDVKMQTIPKEHSCEKPMAALRMKWNGKPPKTKI